MTELLAATGIAVGATVIVETVPFPEPTDAAAVWYVLSSALIYSLNPAIVPTISIGLCVVGDESADAAQIIARVDAALHRAKAEGRNRVVPCADGYTPAR